MRCNGKQRINPVTSLVLMLWEQKIIVAANNGLPQSASPCPQTHPGSSFQPRATFCLLVAHRCNHGLHPRSVCVAHVIQLCTGGPLSSSYPGVCMCKAQPSPPAAMLPGLLHSSHAQAPTNTFALQLHTGSNRSFAGSFLFGDAGVVASASQPIICSHGFCKAPESPCHSLTGCENKGVNTQQWGNRAGLLGWCAFATGAHGPVWQQRLQITHKTREEIWPALAATNRSLWEE